VSFRRLLKKGIFLFFILVYILLNTNVFAQTDLHVSGTIQTAPWFYEFQYELHGISFSTAWAADIEINWFTVGLDIFSDYISVNGTSEDNLFKGAWFNIGSHIRTVYSLNSWLNFSLFTGLCWNQSSFDYNLSGWYGRPLLGLDFILSAHLFLSGFLQLEFFSRLNILFSENKFMDDMSFKGGLRTIINPGLKSIRFYIELDAFYWSYKSIIISEGVHSWMFQGEIGVSLDIWKKSITKTDNKIKNNDLSKNDSESNVETARDQDEDSDKYHDPLIEKLMNSKAGESIEFYSILFDNKDLTEESLPVLKEISEVLLDKKELVISIRGYAEFMQNPQKELELSQIRAKKIKEYLINQGVSDDQVQINPIGNIITDEDPYIVIDVIKNKT